MLGWDPLSLGWVNNKRFKNGKLAWLVVKLRSEDHLYVPPSQEEKDS